MITVATIHFNTPELTEAAILSLRKHGGKGYRVVLFDNSDRRPFTAKMTGVEIIDNTHGEVIDFDKELAKWPDRNIPLGAASNDGSVKHMMTVQKLWDLLPDGFIMMESDILLRRDISFLWDEQWAATGRGEWFNGRRQEHDRLFPFLCYMNVPKLVANGARYFDPERSWNLYPGESEHNFWDTGACLLDDIIKTKPALRAKLYPKLFDCFVHYQGGSWRQKDEENQRAWLEQHRDLWYTPENRDVKLYICAHTDFVPVVSHPAYEVVDARKGGNTIGGIPGPYFSELLQMHRVLKRKSLPKYVGLCHYRRYFDFMDDLPDIAPIIERYGAITSVPEDLGMSVREQWATWGNPADLDIATQIIADRHPDFAEAWQRQLASHSLHLGTMSILRTADWKKMEAVMWDVATEFIRRIGGDIDQRVKDNHDAYHVKRWGEAYARRVGGQFAERINSAWMEWRFPDALRLPIRVTSDKIE